MKKAKSICIFMGLFMIFGVALYTNDLRTDDDIQKNKTKEAHLIVVQEENNENTTEVSTDNSKKKFVMLKEDGYLVVYCGDCQTKYAYTDIEFDMLPDEIKKKVTKGLYFDSEEELYDFLENYDS